MGDTVKQTATQVSSPSTSALYVHIQLLQVRQASSEIMLNSRTDFQRKHFTQTLLYACKAPTETLGVTDQIKSQ